jgi:hypothetical protein
MPRQTQTVPTPSFQTVRLKRGRHLSPDDGVCVMELASMIAGERFTDHPRSVSPVVAEFLRTYNDLVDDDRRQDLYRFAAESVGTRSSRTTERIRADWLPGTPSAALRDRLARRVSTPGRRRAVRAKRVATELALEPARHQAAMALVEQLIAIGSGRPAHSLPAVATQAERSRPTARA